MKTKYPRTRREYKIPDYIPDKQIGRYLDVLKDTTKIDAHMRAHLQSLDAIGCIS